ncbi:hypothetical protein I8752_08135 [Nostocaceae cyanobacterium CENA369]|uniref:Uncharacterized protein n=1 Tax=Dendronalium phyllosphericum CENA369 TaxID=1725256 RepID=A0A8J7I2Q5_9NOST|nr:hypothetical protein [Dendronalium phyllosphericum]MBH8572988.1 hypothetical protein [Dendronalium phyllosphericum CENA369]
MLKNTHTVNSSLFRLFIQINSAYLGIDLAVIKLAEKCYLLKIIRQKQVLAKDKLVTPVFFG